MFYLYPKNKLKKFKDKHTDLICYKYMPYSRLERLYFKLVFYPIISPVLGLLASKRQVKASNLHLIGDMEVANIDMQDWPDLVDAYISYAIWKDSLTPLTDKQLDRLNESFGEFVYEVVYEKAVCG